jgi:hypothetical protein
LRGLAARRGAEVRDSAVRHVTVPIA